MPNLVLTGFMGTGKTAVARCLAARLGWRLLDTDAEIVRRHGPIEQLFAREGEAAFRRIERHLAVEVSRSRSLVVATGGGILVDPAMARLLRPTSTTVCLTASPATILARVQADGTARRPLLDVDDPVARIAELLAARAAAYRAFTQVATDHLAPRAIADLILRRVPIT